MFRTNLLCLFFCFSFFVQAGVATKNPLYKPGSVINVLFLDGDIEQQAIVAAIANEYTQYGFIYFKFNFADIMTIDQISEIEQDANAIIVKFSDSDNHWTTGQNFSGSRNYIISLTGLEPSTILHEFGHALGLKHEHQHPSSEVNVNKSMRKQVCDNAGWTQKECESNIFSKLSPENTRFTSYDKKSIMHYPFSSEITVNNKAYTENKYLSFGDVMVISRLFPGKLANISGRKIKKIIRERAKVFSEKLLFSSLETDEKLTAYLKNELGQIRVQVDYLLKDEEDVKNGEDILVFKTFLNNQHYLHHGIHLSSDRNMQSHSASYNDENKIKPKEDRYNLYSNKLALMQKAKTSKEYKGIASVERFRLTNEDKAGVILTDSRNSIEDNVFVNESFYKYDTGESHFLYSKLVNTSLDSQKVYANFYSADKDQKGYRINVTYTKNNAFDYRVFILKGFNCEYFNASNEKSFLSVQECVKELRKVKRIFPEQFYFDFSYNEECKNCMKYLTKRKLNNEDIPDIAYLVNDFYLTKFSSFRMTKINNIVLEKNGRSEFIAHVKYSYKEHEAFAREFTDHKSFTLKKVGSDWRVSSLKPFVLNNP